MDAWNQASEKDAEEVGSASSNCDTDAADASIALAKPLSTIGPNFDKSQNYSKRVPENRVIDFNQVLN